MPTQFELARQRLLDDPNISEGIKQKVRAGIAPAPQNRPAPASAPISAPPPIQLPAVQALPQQALPPLPVAAPVNNVLGLAAPPALPVPTSTNIDPVTGAPIQIGIDDSVQNPRLPGQGITDFPELSPFVDQLRSLQLDDLRNIGRTTQTHALSLRRE